MKARLLLTVVALALLVLAIGGWTVQGLRWALASPLRARPATA